MFGCKIVEFVFQLPYFSLAHLDDGVLMHPLLVAGVLDVLLAGSLEEVSGSTEEAREQLGGRGEEGEWPAAGNITDEMS